MKEKVDLSAEYIRKRRAKKLWHKIVNVMACIVVFCTTYALILPAITQEQTAYCGYEEHTHTESCYAHEAAPSEKKLICTEDESEPHIHTDGCYLSAHSHDDGCYETVLQDLLCGLQETEGHRHGEDCFEEDTLQLICQEEVSENHSHAEECYQTVKGALICTEEESEGHAHGDDCYSSSQKNLICEIPEREVPELICQLTETEGHSHGEDCYEAVTTDPEAEPVCGKEAHTHSLACYSNPEADVESAAVWEAVLPKDLPEIWPDALVAVAQSQLGYTESSRNYRVVQDTEVKGYSRYGAWAVDPYGDWNVSFVRFCLYYAGIPQDVFPGYPDVQQWKDALNQCNRYAYADDGSYTPNPGDLLFLKKQDQPMVGIVLSYNESGYVTAAIGDYENRVAQETFAPGAQEIMGYGILPSNRQEESAEPVPTTRPVEEAESPENTEDDQQTEDAASKEQTEEGGFFAGEIFAYESYIDGAYVNIATLALAKEEIKEIRLVPVNPVAQASALDTQALTKNRILDRRTYQIQFLDEAGNMLTDVQDQELEIMLSWDTPLKDFEDAATQPHVYVHNGNQTTEVEPLDLTASEALISLTGLDAGTDNPYVDIMVVASDKLEEGVHGTVHVKYNYQRDAFIYDSAYAKYYNADSPLGTAGSFHIVAFTKAKLSAHTNGNILAKELDAASNNFGTNSKNNVDLEELHYIQYYPKVNANSSADQGDVLVIGDNNTVSHTGGGQYKINGQNVDKPQNLVIDDNTANAPFIDLARVENEIKTISANLAAYPTVENSHEMTYNIKPTAGQTFIRLQDPDNIGVVNMTAAEMSAIRNSNYELRMEGFAANGSGAIIVNVDCAAWPAGQDLWIPNAYVYVDGVKQETAETLDFSAGKVIWNFINADHVSVHAQHMTGMIVAPESDVVLEYSFNGTAIGDTVENKTESHRTDFMGKIYFNEFHTGAHVHVYKVDKGNYGKYLEGAEFTIYQWDKVQGKYVPAALTDADGNTYPNTLVSDGDGLAFFEGLRYNVAYRILETKAPDNYIREQKGIYLFYEHADTAKYPVSKPADFQGSSLEDDCYIHYIPNIPSEVPTTDLTVQKVWQDQNGNALPLVPDSVTVEIWRSEQQMVQAENGELQLAEAGNDSLYGSYTLTAADDWTLTVDGLPKTNGEMTVQYSYYVKEITVDGCTATSYTYSEDRTEVIITNTMNVQYEYGTMALNKSWFDVPQTDPENQTVTEVPLAQSEIPVDVITVTIYQITREGEDGPWSEPKEFKTVTVTSVNNWKWESNENEFPKSLTVGNQTYYYSYYAEETLIPGFAPDGNVDADSAVTIPQMLELDNTRIETTDLQITKVWKDENGSVMDPFHHDPIKIYVYRLENGVRQEKPWYTMTVSEENGWKASLSELPLTDPYGKITYTYEVEEEPIPGYTDTYAVDVSGGVTSVTVTNREAASVDLTVNKAWVSNHGVPINAPANVTEVTVNIYRHVNGVKETAIFRTLTLKASENWTATLEDLPGYDGTNEYTYSAEELPVHGFEASYTQKNTENGSTITVTNKELGEKTSITVNKQWLRGSVDVTAAQSTPVQFYLYQIRNTGNGSAGAAKTVTINSNLLNAHTSTVTAKVGDTVTITMVWTSNTQWGPDVTGFDPKIQVGGVDIPSVCESPDGKNARITASFAVTENMAPSVSVNNREYLWYGGDWDIQVQAVSSSDVPYAGPFTLSPANGWSQTIRELPRKEIAQDGKEIFYSYFVKEVGGEQYAVSYRNNDIQNGIENGTITIQNQAEDVKTSITVQKQWLDEDGTVMGNVTGEIQFKLYQIGSDGNTVPYPNEDHLYTLSQALNGWQMTISDLPYINDEGTVTYGYYVEEQDPGQYTVTYTTPDGKEIGPKAPVGTGTVVITNQVTPESFLLPETGGIGTTLYTTVGMMLFCGSAYLLYNQKKRRRGDPS